MRLTVLNDNLNHHHRVTTTTVCTARTRLTTQPALMTNVSKGMKPARLASESST